MEYLPREIINIILEYTGVIKYRNGKYMNQILRDDIRYHMIKTISKPIESHIPGGFYCSLHFSSGYDVDWSILFQNQNFVTYRFITRSREAYYLRW